MLRFVARQASAGRGMSAALSASRQTSFIAAAALVFSFLSRFVYHPAFLLLSSDRLTSLRFCLLVFLLLLTGLFELRLTVRLFSSSSSALQLHFNSPLLKTTTAAVDIRCPSQLLCVRPLHRRAPAARGCGTASPVVVPRASESIRRLYVHEVVLHNYFAGSAQKKKPQMQKRPSGMQMEELWRMEPPAPRIKRRMPDGCQRAALQLVPSERGRAAGSRCSAPR